MGDARKTEYGPSKIIGMAGKTDTYLFADRDNRIEEVLIVLEKYLRSNSFILPQRLFELRKPF